MVQKNYWIFRTFCFAFWLFFFYFIFYFFLNLITGLPPPPPPRQAKIFRPLDPLLFNCRPSQSSEPTFTSAHTPFEYNRFCISMSRFPFWIQVFFPADGFFTIVGRKKEIIITAGKTAEKDQRQFSFDLYCILYLVLSFWLLNNWNFLL